MFWRMHDEESFLGKYILKGMNLAFLPYVLFKRDGGRKEVEASITLHPKINIGFPRNLGNNAMLSSSSIVVSNDQFHWYSMHKTMRNVLLIQLHKNLVYRSYDICLYIPYSTYVKWWCIMWAPTLEFFIKKLHYVDYRWPFFSWSWCVLTLCPNLIILAWAC